MAASTAADQDEKKTFLTEPNLRGEELTDDFPDYEEDMAPEEDNQDTAMLKKEHQMRIMDDALELMKREFAARMEEVARKEARLAKEKAALDAMVEKFRDFIQENDAKKEKALRKAAEEDEAISRLTTEEATWESQIEDAKRKRQLLSDQIHSLTTYHTYLMSVAKSSGGEFSDTADMLARYATLAGMHGAQDSTMRSKQADVKRLREEIAATIAESDTRKLELSSAIEAARKEMDDLMDRGRELEDERAAADDATRRSVVEESQVAMSVSNLFGRCRDSIRVTAAARGPPPGAVASSSASVQPKAAKTTAKLMSQMTVAPPANDSKKEVFRHLSDTLEVVEKRLLDLVELERGYPEWKTKQAKAAAQAEAASRRAREEAMAARRAKAEAMAGARQRVAGIKQQRSQQSLASVTSDAELLDGGGSIMTATGSETGGEGEGAAFVDGQAVARQLAGNTFVVRLGGAGGAGAGAGSGGAGSALSSTGGPGGFGKDGGATSGMDGAAGFAASGSARYGRG